MRALFVFVFLVLSAATCVAADRPVEERQLLLMLRVPPPHFRPDAYTGGHYESAPGREARRRFASALARTHDLRLVDDWPMPALGLDCFVLEAATGDTGRRAVELLAADPRVESVQPMQRFHTLGAGDPLSAAQPAIANWNLRELHRLATGRSVTVAVLDTGVDTTHPDLRGQVALTRNFVDAGAMPAETHGTEIAGILVARADNGIGIAGIAPRARLLALRACWQPEREDNAAICSSFTLAKALQFALTQRADVFNLSLSGPPDRLLARLLDAALRQGVIVVGAVDAHAADGGFPAAHPGVFAVADARDGHRRTDALLAPAHGIPTTTSGGGWTLVSGASFAAAQVSGLAALLRQLSPRLHAAGLRSALATDAVGSAPRRPALIDACAAVESVAQRCACDCAAGQTANSMPRR